MVQGMACTFDGMEGELLRGPLCCDRRHIAAMFFGNTPTAAEIIQNIAESPCSIA